MSQHPSCQGRAAEAETAAAGLAAVTAEPAAVYTPVRRYADRACCCPSQPAVIAVLPPGNGLRVPTDLLLCGHHYRVSKAALVAAGAVILDVRGYPLTAGDWPDPA